MIIASQVWIGFMFFGLSLIISGIFYWKICDKYIEWLFCNYHDKEEEYGHDIIQSEELYNYTVLMSADNDQDITIDLESDNIGEEIGLLVEAC